MSMNEDAKKGNPKLIISFVMSDTISTYKTGFKTFIFLSFLQFLINIPDLFVSYYRAMNQHLLGLDMSLAFVEVLLTIASAFITLLITATFYQVASSTYQSNICDIKESFRKAKGVYWRFFGVTFMFGLIVLAVTIPVLAILRIGALPFKMMVALFGLLGIYYFIITYTFAPISAILKSEKHRYFQESKRLIKGDFFRMALLEFIAFAVIILPGQIITRVVFDYANMDINQRLMASLYSMIFLIVIRPFSMILSVIAYHMLQRNKG